MSEPMFPSTAEAPAPVVQETPASGGANRKALLAVGGALAALAVGAGAFFLLTASGGSDDVAAPVTAAKGVAPTAAPSASASAGVKVVTVKPAVVTGRDPFAPLVAVAAVAPASTTTTSTAPSVQVQTPVQTTTTFVLSSVDQAKGTAAVTVDNKPYTAVIGTPFGTYYQLYAVFNTKCAGFLVGDVSVPVCIGTPAKVVH